MFMSFFIRCVLFLVIGGLLTFLVYTVVSTLYPMGPSTVSNRVHVVPTQHQDFVIATGTIEAQDDVLLAFEEGGVVRDVYYAAGDFVTAGSVIATLGAETLHADIATQKSNLEREKFRLDSVVDGPENPERATVEADVAVSEQLLTSAVRTALVSVQQSAVTLENMFFIDLDVLFGGSTKDPYFEGDVSVVAKQQINRARRDAGEVFDRWRVWLSNDRADRQQVVAILTQFEKDLRVLYDGALVMYDHLLPLRSLNQENRDAFLLLAKVRNVLIDSLVKTIEHTNSINTAQARYELVLAQSARSLSGGTKSDQNVQSAQVDAERERLRRLELQLGKTQVLAPFNGVIGEIFVNPGMFITRGAGVVRFVSKDQFDLSVDVTEVEVRHITTGQEMRAVIEVTDQEMQVRVRTINATEKRVNDVPVYTIIFDVIDTVPHLRSGITVNVHIPSGDLIDVFAVPRHSIMKKELQEYVVVERGGDVISVPVTLAASLDDGTVVVTGELYADDVVTLEKGSHEQE